MYLEAGVGPQVDKAIARTVPGVKSPQTWWGRLDLRLMMYDWWVDKYESFWGIKRSFISQSFDMWGYFLYHLALWP